jgi:hypothetical protein
VSADKCEVDAVKLVMALRNTSVAVLDRAARYARREHINGTMTARTLDVILAQLRYLGHREEER